MFAAAGMGSDLVPFIKGGRLDISALEQKMKGMVFVEAAAGVMPETQKDADDLKCAAALSEEAEDFLAADWYQHQQQYPQQQQALLTPTAPWAKDTAAEGPSEYTAAVAAAAAGVDEAAGPPGSL